MRVLSWNVAARRRAQLQAGAIAAVAPDVVVLQEVTASLWRELGPMLACEGLAHALCGPEAMASGEPLALTRWVVVASRWPLSPCEPASVPAREVVVCATVDGPAGAFSLAGVHIPTIGRGMPLKLGTQEGLYAWLAARGGSPLVVAGDFNSPKAEAPDGTVTPFMSRRNERSYAAEDALMAGMPAVGLHDAFRSANGYALTESSWYWKNRGRTGGYRLDHIFASPNFRPVASRYLHDTRESGLSDHSALVAEFEYGP